VIAVAQSKLTNAEYHAHPAVGHSALDEFRASRKRYKARYIDKTLVTEPTEAMTLGSLFHTMTVEPHRTDELYAVAPVCDRRTKDGKAAWAEFCSNSIGKTVVAADTFKQASDMVAALFANDTARELIESAGPVEESQFWVCPETGLQCKSRPDKQVSDIAFLVDLKSCVDATPAGFAKSAASYGYDRQAAWYSWGHELLHGVRPNFVFIAVEKNAPFEVGIYELSSADTDRAREQNRSALRALANCIETGQWEPQHARKIVELSLPRWTDYSDEYVSY